VRTQAANLLAPRRELRRSLHTTQHGTQRVQVFGDWCQAPPIKGRFFFHSPLWSTFTCIIRLQQSHRQLEPDFVTMLNKMRIGTITAEDMEIVHTWGEDARKKENEFLVTTIVATNSQADAINAERLAALLPTTAAVVFEAVPAIRGDKVPPKAVIDQTLKLKVGARVIFLQNRPQRNLFHGSQGSVRSFQPDPTHPAAPPIGAWVAFDGITEPELVGVDSFECTLRDGRTAAFTQLPITLAWALTAHKAQGMSIKYLKADINGMQMEWARALAYVAATRGMTMAGTWIVGLPAAFRPHPEAIAMDRAADQLCARLYGWPVTYVGPSLDKADATYHANAVLNAAVALVFHPRGACD
jgi:hypothetical protein